MRRLVLAAPLLVAFAAPVAAQQLTTNTSAADVVFTLGGGGKVSPEYEGSKDYAFSPFPILGLKFKVNPLTGQPSSETGFGIRPAFRYIGKRDASTNSALSGLNAVDASYELGLYLDWTDTNWRAFVEARQGFGGHHGQVFDLGVDAILRPFQNVTVNAGPRLSFATSDYMSTYFDVSAAESLTSGYAAYSANGGLKSYGVGTTINFDITPNWLVRVEGSYSRLADEAANSPIVDKAGSADQFSVGIGAAYRFGLSYK
jgi:outer membrane scaffolding protein for murein synthesis (MipA/OmpV family)